MKHTPTPYHFIKEDWTIRSKEIDHSTQMADYKGSIICSLVEGHGNREHALEETKANAHFIITACNSHDELVEACKEILVVRGREGHAEYSIAMDHIEQAIAKAEGR